jgi:formylglycine-generating enzyme
MMPEAFPPPWAARWGDDECGLWAELEVKGVAQRMRWLAPGEFLMGSPNHEVGARKSEKPQHRVRISQGFWFADTPCTQDLWQAVTGDWTKRYKGSPRPVTDVNWDQVLLFCSTLDSALCDAAEADLPTEAQWEFACRAGTTTLFGLGSNWIAGAANNAGSHDNTTFVKKYRPNAWGLFDCHGQVWEWCVDDLRDYSAVKIPDKLFVDPIGPLGNESNDCRALRGGAWFSQDDNTRSASRTRSSRRSQSYQVGFRFTVIPKIETEDVSPQSTFLL